MGSSTIDSISKEAEVVTKLVTKCTYSKLLKYSIIFVQLLEYWWTVRGLGGCKILVRTCLYTFYILLILFYILYIAYIYIGNEWKVEGFVCPGRGILSLTRPQS